MDQSMKNAFGYWRPVNPDANSLGSRAEWGYLDNISGANKKNKSLPAGWKGDLMFSPNMPPLASSAQSGTTSPASPSHKNSNNKAVVTDVVIMIPGNPGVVDWYTDLSNKLVQQSKGKVAMLSVGYMGHHCGRISSKTSSSCQRKGIALLQDQIEGLGLFFDTVLRPSFEDLAKGGKITVHVAGHSIGAFVSAHMAARFPDLVQGKCFLLAPTICNMKQSPNGRKNDAALCWPLIMGISAVATVATRLIPLSVQKGVVRGIEKTPMQDDHLDIALGMGKSCPGTLQSLLFMGRSEFDQLTTIDPHLLAMVGGRRTVAYFVDVDGWVPHSDIALFRQNCAVGSSIVMEPNPNVPHAWVLGFNDEVVQNAFTPFIQALQ